MTEETRISVALERIATALETIAECEVKSVALSNKFADTNENLNSVLNLIKGKPPEINPDSYKGLIADEQGRPAFDRFGNKIKY